MVLLPFSLMSKSEDLNSSSYFSCVNLDSTKISKRKTLTQTQKQDLLSLSSASPGDLAIKAKDFTATIKGVAHFMGVVFFLLLEVSEVSPSCIMLPPSSKPKIGTKFLALYTRSYGITPVVFMQTMYVCICVVGSTKSKTILMIYCLEPETSSFLNGISFFFFFECSL